jgi:hypothetical protein
MKTTLTILLLTICIYANSQFGMKRDYIDSVLFKNNYKIEFSSNSFTMIRVEKRINIAYIYDELQLCEAVYIFKNDSIILQKFMIENDFIFNNGCFENDCQTAYFVQNYKKPYIKITKK